MRLALCVDYHGLGFQGWQIQPHGPSVAGCLEQAIAKVADHPVKLVGSGRTDSGVHALGQIVHVDVTSKRTMHQWLLGINYHLPDTVAVRWVCEVASDFHARFSALARRYVYLITQDAAPSGLRGNQMLRVYKPLCLRAMSEAANCLLGEHDFTAFRSSQCQAKTATRRVFHVDIASQGDCIVVDIAANAFLHHMVRNLVGSLLMVGKGERDVKWLAEVLASRDRSRAADKIAPTGLYLLQVLYPQVYVLPEPQLTFMGLDFSAQALTHDSVCLDVVS